MTSRKTQTIRNLTPALVALRDAAMLLIPTSHAEGDAAWVETTETLRHDADARRLSAAALARLVAANLDTAAAEWEAERAYLASAQEG